jgi:hypothetical protein
MNDFEFPPIPPPLTRSSDMRSVAEYITNIANDNNISIPEILRLSGAFNQNPPYNELGFGRRTFQVCFPTEDSFIGFVRYDEITDEKINALGQKYRDFIAPQQGGKRNRRNKTRRRSKKSKRNKRSKISNRRRR